MTLNIFVVIPWILATFILVSSLIQHRSVRKYARFTTYYIFPIVLLSLVLLHPERVLFTTLGDLAEILVIIILFLRPLAYISSCKILNRAVGYRRELGIASFWFFIFHAGSLIIDRQFTVSSFETPFLFWGLIAGIGLILLALTSNNYSVKLLKRNWKKLQYIAYPTLLIILIHSSLIVYDNLRKLFIIGGLFVVLKLLEHFKVKFPKHI